MAVAGYRGYLIKVIGLPDEDIMAKSRSVSDETEDYIFPMEYIVEKSYTAVYSVLDADASRNGVGDLIRKTIPKKKAHCSIQLRALNNTQFAEIFTNLEDRYIIRKERKLELSIFVPEKNGYVNDFFYIPDPQPTISRIEGDTVYYEPYELEFIGY